MKRKDLQSHLQIQCSKVLRQCEFAQYGCNDTIIAEMYEQHIKNQSQVHLAMVMRTLNTNQQFSSVPPDFVTPSTDGNSLRRRSIPPTAPSYYDQQVLSQSNVPAISPSLPNLQQENQFPQMIPNAPANSVWISTAETAARSLFANLTASVSSLMNQQKNQQNAADTTSYSPAAVDIVNDVLKKYVNPIINQIVTASQGSEQRQIMFPAVAIFLLFLLLYIVMGPIMFVFRLSILGFTCLATFKYLSTTTLLSTPETRTFGLFGYGILALYLTSCLL